VIIYLKERKEEMKRARDPLESELMLLKVNAKWKDHW